MAIKSQQIESAGLAGVTPRIIYLETDDTQTKVKEDGYLNSMFESGADLKESDIAVVKTKLPTRSDLYHVQKVGQNWNLVPLGGGQGGSAWLFDGSNVGNGILKTDAQMEIQATDISITASNNIVFNGLKDLTITGDNLGTFSVTNFFVTKIEGAEIQIGFDPTSPAIYMGHGSSLVQIDSPLFVLRNLLPTSDPPSGFTFKTLQVAVAGPTVGLVRYAP